MCTISCLIGFNKLPRSRCCCKQRLCATAQSAPLCKSERNGVEGATFSESVTEALHHMLPQVLHS